MTNTNDSSAVFKSLSDEARQAFIAARAPFIYEMLLARSKSNFESRCVKRVFGCKIDPKSLVDHFPSPGDDDRKFGVTEPGHYYFDDTTFKYVGPMTTHTNALHAAAKSLGQTECEVPNKCPECDVENATETTFTAAEMGALRHIIWWAAGQCREDTIGLILYSGAKHLHLPGEHAAVNLAAKLENKRDHPSPPQS